MTPRFSSRRQLMTSAAALALAGLTAGCAGSGAPATQPSTQPTPDDQAYATAQQIAALAEAVANGLIADGVLAGADALAAKSAEAAVNSALTAWGANLDSSSSAELAAAFYAVLPGLVAFLASGHAAKAAMAMMHPRASFQEQHPSNVVVSP